LGVYVKNETVNLGNMEIRAAKVVQVAANSLASNFIRPGDMIITIRYSGNSFGQVHIAPEPSRNAGKLGNIDSNYIGISQMINRVNQYGLVNSDKLRYILSSISEGEAFGVIVLRNGRFIEYTLY